MLRVFNSFFCFFFDVLLFLLFSCIVELVRFCLMVCCSVINLLDLLVDWLVRVGLVGSLDVMEVFWMFFRDFVIFFKIFLNSVRV